MKAHVVTLGCPKNIVDAEATISLLTGAGCAMTPDPRLADLLVVNSCSFLESAWQETVDEVRRLSRFKRRGRGKKLVLMGCLPNHRNENLRASLPWVDHFLPSGTQAQFPGLIEQWRSKAQGSALPAAASMRDPFAAYEDRDVLTPPHMAYVKIAEGCDRSCTFCAIPAIRGPFTCRRPISIFREIEHLLGRGVREITLIAQDVLSYSSDGLRFPDLVGEIARMGVDWIRILYVHPDALTLDIVDRFFQHPSVCRYLEIPIQHISTRILKRMERSRGERQLESLFSGIRSNFPDAVIRSEVIIGFPGESDADFEKLKAFVASVRFSSLGIFSFSAEQGTRAADFGGIVPDDVKEERIAELAAIQQVASFDVHSGYRGGQLRVLVDRKMRDGEGPFDDCGYAGRFYGQAYEIDGEVYLRGNGICVGDFVTARITDNDVHDLKGEVL